MSNAASKRVCGVRVRVDGLACLVLVDSDVDTGMVSTILKSSTIVTHTLPNL